MTAGVSKLVFLVTKLKPVVAKQNKSLLHAEQSLIPLFPEPHTDLLYPYPIFGSTFIKGGIDY